MIQLDENRPAKVAKDSHSPSLDIREEAARLFEMMARDEDAYREASDNRAVDTLAIGLDYARSKRLYDSFCEARGFRLLTDVSGLFLRCAETNIPLVVTDECVGINTGEFVLVKQAA